MQLKRSGAEPTSVGPEDFDLGAAWLRRAQGDLGAFVEALAVRLEAALLGAVTVERRRDGLFSRKAHVAAIAVRTPTGVLSLKAGHGHLLATRTKVVRGVSIGSEEITVPAWLDEVLRSTRTLGQEADAAHEALHTFLMG